MRVALTQLYGFKLSVMAHPTGDVFQFEVPENGARAFFLARGAIELKPVGRKHFGNTVRIESGMPHVVLAPGRYCACATTTTIGLMGTKQQRRTR